MILAVGLEPVEEKGSRVVFFSCFKPTRRCIRPAQGTLSWYGTTVSIWWEAKDLRAKRLMDLVAKKPAVWGRRWLPTFFFWDSQDGNFPSIMTRQPFEPSNIPQLVDSRGEWNATLYGEYEIADEILIEIPSPTSWGEIILLVAIALPFALALILSPMKESGF